MYDEVWDSGFWKAKQQQKQTNPLTYCEKSLHVKQQNKNPNNNIGFKMAKVYLTDLCQNWPVDQHVANSASDFDVYKNVFQVK